MDPLDFYCERLGPGLLGEPLNASTNLAFLLAAWAAWRFASRRGALDAGAWTLVALMAAIAVGSGLFHTFANTATHTLDTTPILLFQLAFLWLYARQVLDWRRWMAAALVAAFVAMGLWARGFPGVWNGSFAYLPALLVLAALAVVHATRRLAGRWHLALAAALLVLSLLFRTIDAAACDAFPVGTHFLWHLLNALVLYLCARALLLNRATRSASKAI